MCVNRVVSREVFNTTVFASFVVFSKEMMDGWKWNNQSVTSRHAPWAHCCTAASSCNKKPPGLSSHRSRGLAGTTLTTLL